MLKTSKDSLGVERHTLEVFDTLRFQHDEYIPAASDYEHHRAATHVYLGGGAGHMFYDDSLPAPPGTSFARTYINIGDHLGSTSVVIDKTTSELVERSTFMAYGAIESAHRPARWSHAREPYKFTGKEEDIEVGATYFGARYYNAHLGRFMSPDPLTIHGFSSDMNPYAYVRGRVMSHVDPLGLADQQAQEQAKAGADANLPGTGGLGPPTPVLGHHDFGGWTVDVTGPAGTASSPFAAAQTSGSGMGGPMVSPDASGIGGLETLDRGNGSAPGWSAPRGNHFGLDEVGDTKWMDDRGSNLAKHPEAIAPEAATFAGVILAAVVINVTVAELSAASAAGGGGVARWAISSLLSAIGNKAQGCSSGCNSPAGRAALQGAIDRVRTQCAGASCDNLSRALIKDLGGGQLLTLFPKGGGALPTLPGVAPTPWAQHTAVRIADGTVMDPLRNQIYGTLDAWRAAVTGSADVGVMIDGVVK